MIRSDEVIEAAVCAAAEPLGRDGLLFFAGAGVCHAGLITLMASADAFSARLTASVHHASELSTLHMRQLALSLADMQPQRRERSVTDLSVRSTSSRTTSYPPGYPVVT